MIIYEKYLSCFHIQIHCSAMFTPTVTVNGNVTMQEVKDRVLAVATSIFFVYLMNFGSQGFATFVQKEDEKKKHVLRKLLETSQVLYWFGIAAIFSVYPPDFYGIHSAIFAYVTLLSVVFLHVLCFFDKRQAGRSLWAIMYVLYHISIFIWIIFALVIGYVWSEENY